MCALNLMWKMSKICVKMRHDSGTFGVIFWVLCSVGCPRIWLLLSILWHRQNIDEATDNYPCINRLSAL